MLTEKIEQFLRTNNGPLDMVMIQHLIKSYLAEQSRVSLDQGNLRVISVVNQLPLQLAERSAGHLFEKQDEYQRDTSHSFDRFSPCPSGKKRNHHRKQTLRISFKNEPRWQAIKKTSHAPLYAALKSLNESVEHIVIGYPGTVLKSNKQPFKSDHLTEDDKAGITRAYGKNYIPIFLNDDDAEGHYAGYCKSVLWPVLHYEEDYEFYQKNTDWLSYQKVCQAFADKIASVYKQGDIVCIHDYHLLLVAQMLRKEIKDCTIGLFLHTPFPAYPVFSFLPQRDAILNGMLSANVIAFQKGQYLINFIESCRAALTPCDFTSTMDYVDYKGHRIDLGVLPMGIDVDSARAIYREKIVQSEIKNLRKKFEGYTILISICKLQPDKGVSKTLEGYQYFLKKIHKPSKSDELRNRKFVLIILTTPSTTTPHSLREEIKVHKLIESIVCEYGKGSYCPVFHYPNNLDANEYYAFLAAGDVIINTSIRDGLNTTMFDYVIAQEENHGSMVLSKFAGVGSIFQPGAELVSPWRPKAISKAIIKVLKFDKEERKMRHKALHDIVCKYTAQRWANRFVKLVIEANDKETSREPALLDGDSLEKLIRDYSVKKKRLLLFDYDGTLTKIVLDPETAELSPDARNALAALTQDENNDVWVISGRTQAKLDKWLGGIPRLGLCAELGRFIRKPKDNEQWQEQISSAEDEQAIINIQEWKEKACEIFKEYGRHMEGDRFDAARAVRCKKTSVIWHYRRYYDGGEYCRKQVRLCQQRLKDELAVIPGVDVYQGNHCLEVRPIFLSKDNVVRGILEKGELYRYIMCVGDGRTDEHMFKYLHDSTLPSDGVLSPSASPPLINKTETSLYMISVGDAKKKTWAGLSLQSADEVVNLLLKRLSAESHIL